MHIIYIIYTRNNINLLFTAAPSDLPEEQDYEEDSSDKGLLVV